jgi:L-lactate dehydrogenase (cytochrome)
MIKRRIPRVGDLRPLLRFKSPELNAKKRRLSSALTIYDLREIAKQHTPKAAFDYVEGGADSEISVNRARQAFEDIQFNPQVLRDVLSVSTSWDVLGAPVALPFGIAPTGFTRLMHTEGESAGADGAGTAGIPFALSTMGTTSIEDVRAANPGGLNWFQLYIWRDRERSMALIDRATKAEFDTLIVTVDVPVAGADLRDTRNGMSIPPALTLKAIANAIPRPEWWFNFLATEPLAFASLDRWSGMIAELTDKMFDPSVTFEDLGWIRTQWPGKILVKGVQSLADARALVDLGVDGITLSNHGGRQLDRASIPFHLDTGIMSGADIVASVAMGLASRLSVAPTSTV